MNPSTEPTDRPDCAICGRQPAAERSQTCGGCAHGIRQDLDAWPDLVALLPAAVAPSIQAWREPGPRGAEPALPGGEALNLTAAGNLGTPQHFVTHLRTVRHVEEIPVPGLPRPLVRESWTVELVADDGHPTLIPDGDQHGDLPPHLTVARWCARWAALRGVGELGVPSVSWLAERLDWALREHPDIATFADELRHATDAMRQVLNLKRYVQRYRQPCPRCDTAGSLRRVIDPMDEDDSQARYITCGVCGTMWTMDEWEQIAAAKELAG